jgi:hypothetical protein
VPTNTLVLGTKYANNARNQSTFVGVSHGITGVGAPVIDFFSPEDLANAQRPIVGPKGVTGLRQTRTLPMVRWTAPGAPFVNPLPLVPPSLTWSFTTTPPQVVPRAFNDTTTAPAPIPPGGLQVLPNVLSFHVQIMPKHDPRFTTYPYWTDAEPMLSGKLPSGDSNGSALDPNNTNMQTFAARLYDTGAHHDPTTFEKLTPPTDPSKKTLPPWWASAPPPGQTIPPWPYQTYLYGNYPYPVLAVQITLRIWDPRSQQARQLTVTQDL